MMNAVRHVAGVLGMSPETLRLWQRRYEVEAGVKSGMTTDAAAEIKRLQKEVSEAGSGSDPEPASSLSSAPPVESPTRRMWRERRAAARVSAKPKSSAPRVAKKITCAAWSRNSPTTASSPSWA